MEGRSGCTRHGAAPAEVAGVRLPLDAKENPYGEDDSKSPFPLQPRGKRSYAQNVTVWIKPSGLQVTRTGSRGHSLAEGRVGAHFPFL